MYSNLLNDIQRVGRIRPPYKFCVISVFHCIFEKKGKVRKSDQNIFISSVDGQVCKIIFKLIFFFQKFRTQMAQNVTRVFNDPLFKILS